MNPNGAVRAVPTICVVLAAAVAGMLFAPVFGVPALLLPIGVPALTVLLATLACSRSEALLPWRPLLVGVAGLLAVAETVLWPTTAAGVPTGRTMRALASGFTGSWQLALQSTWPARPDPEMLLFVPLLVVLTGVLGIELLHRMGRPLVALAPSFAVAVFSQLYAPLPPAPGVAAALGYAAVAGALLVVAGGTDPDRGGQVTPGFPSLRNAVPPVVLAIAGVILAALLLPTTQPRYSLRQDRLAPLTETQVISPLDEIAYRLAHPGTAALRVRDGAGADRWPLVVFDTFDGVNWQPGGRYRRLGTELSPGPAVTVPVRPRSTQIDALDTGGGPWLPSQTWPAAVQGVDPLVEEDQGTLLVPGSGGTARYTLTWWQPEIDSTALEAAAIDPLAPGGFGDIGPVPPGVAELAERATGGLRPTFQAALVLERFLQENYRLATGQDLPTGHAWPQLTDFLLHSRRGTSEQYATAYVALARIRGIPARLVVGFRTPAGANPGGQYTIHNGDVLAWPEVAVQGIGWVPLDPAGAPPAAATSRAGLAAATARVRSQLPAPEELRDPPVAPQPAAASRPGNGGAMGAVAWAQLLVAVPLLLAMWLLGVPAVSAGRAWRRRRRPGAGAVVGAWQEVRDRLRAHGVVVSAAMTVRDLAAVAAAVTDQSTVDGIRRLGTIVDRALWSPAAPGDRDGRQAWAVVREVRRGLGKRGLRARMWALLSPRGLLPPRG
jgi:protein-glutamine gamma-glutamyltransferase